MLIALEGIEGTGKTTLMRMLGRELEREFRDEGLKVTMTYEPWESDYGRKAREMLRRKSLAPHERLELALLFILDRMVHVREVILPNLMSGNAVICDRYVHSNLAYQAADGIDVSILLKLNEEFPRPNVVILLDVEHEDVEKLLLDKLKTSRAFRFDEAEFLRRVRGNYIEFICRRRLLMERPGNCLYINVSKYDMSSEEGRISLLREVMGLLKPIVANFLYRRRKGSYVLLP